jgi:hypothetical protein
MEYSVESIETLWHNFEVLIGLLRDSWLAQGQLAFHAV